MVKCPGSLASIRGASVLLACGLRPKGVRPDSYGYRGQSVHWPQRPTWASKRLFLTWGPPATPGHEGDVNAGWCLSMWGFTKPQMTFGELAVHPSSREIVKCDYTIVMYVIQFQVGLKNKKTESIFKPGCLLSVRRLARNYGHLSQLKGFLGSAGGKGPACPCRRYKRCGFDPRIGKILWRRAWQPTPVFLPRESPQTEEPGGLQS